MFPPWYPVVLGLNRAKIVVLGTVPPDCVSVTELLNVMSFLDTSNPDGAVTSMFAVRKLPDTVYDRDEEFVPT
jgi:hypothetical protein